MRLFRSGMALAFLVGSFFVHLSKAQANAGLCRDLFEPSIFNSKPDRLYDEYLNETQNLDSKQIQSLNQNFVSILKKFVPTKHERRAQTVSIKQTQKMLDIVTHHRVVGLHNDNIYARPNEEMGFCFGRAMYLHLLSLKLGLHKGSIKKIWALGPMDSGTPNVTWGYHVALMVFSKEKAWVVLDANIGRVVTAEQWVRIYTNRSLDQRVRFYASEPEKFGLYAGKYSRYILGLDLNTNDDWFKHYFVDMLRASRSETLESLGLKK